MLKACRYCGKVHDSKHDCGRKPKKISKRTEEEQGRYTSTWNKKSADIKERSLYLCAVCREQGQYISDGLETHHVIKLRDRPDLLLEDSNLICLCRRCHEAADNGEISPEYLRELAIKRDR